MFKFYFWKELLFKHLHNLFAPQCLSSFWLTVHFLLEATKMSLSSNPFLEGKAALLDFLFCATPTINTNPYRCVGSNTGQSKLWTVWKIWLGFLKTYVSLKYSAP